MPFRTRYRPRFDILEKRIALHSSGDTDIQVGYDAGTDTWTLDLLLAEDLQGVEVEYTIPASTPLTPGPQIESRPADPDFDFTGVNANERLYILPEATTEENVLTIALSAGLTPPGTFAEYTETDARIAGQTAEFIKLHLVDVRGPVGSHFSVWQVDFNLDAVMWMSTFDNGIDASDVVFLVPPSHGHFALGFTRPGKYEIDLKASAFLGPGETNPVESPVETYTFIIRDPIVAVTGADRGSKPVVRVVDAVSGDQVQRFLAYPGAFRGGVRVATGDVNGDGRMDIVTAPGNGLPILINVYDGATDKKMAGFKPGLKPYGNFAGGAWVAVGELDGQPGDEIVVGPGRSARSVKVYDQTGAVLAAFQPFGTSFTGGVRVAVADGKIICSQASGASAVKVLVFNGGNPAEQESFTAFAGVSGAYVAAADVNGDATADFIVGSGLGNAVKVFDGTDPDTVLANFRGFPNSAMQGVRVAALDINFDGRADLFLSPGAGKAFPIRILNSPNALEGEPLTDLKDYFLNGPGFLGGSFIASGIDH